MKKNIIILLYLVFVLSCTKNSEYIISEGTLPNDIISITSIKPEIALADSNSQIIIRVNINPTTDSAQSITLTTDKGIINGKSNSETVLTNLNRYADFILTSGQMPGIVSLRASVAGSYIRDTIVNFIKAYPDSIIVQPDAFTIAKNSGLTTSVTFFSTKGYPSKNQSLLFSAIDSTGNSAGKFITTDTFTPGHNLVTKFTPNQDFAGHVTLIVFDVHDDGSKLIGSSKINIQ